MDAPSRPAAATILAAAVLALGLVGAGALVGANIPASAPPTAR
jgi:hypothetical protein